MKILCEVVLIFPSYSISVLKTLDDIFWYSNFWFIFIDSMFSCNLIFIIYRQFIICFYVSYIEKLFIKIFVDIEIKLIQEIWVQFWFDFLKFKDYFP